MKPKFFLSMNLLTYINNATDWFGGAIDIILIKQPDGSLKTTPFHVRFGRFKLLRSADKNIRIMINDKLTDMIMRINPVDGVAYFVQDEDDESLNTSQANELSNISSLDDVISPLSDNSFGSYNSQDEFQNRDSLGDSSLDKNESSNNSLLDDFLNNSIEDSVSKEIDEIINNNENIEPKNELKAKDLEIEIKQKVNGTKSSMLSSLFSATKKIFGMQDEKEEVFERNEYVEQSLKETLHKKYNYNVDEKSDDISPVFEIEDLRKVNLSTELNDSIPTKSTSNLIKDGFSPSIPISIASNVRQKLQTDPMPISNSITKPPKLHNSVYDFDSDLDDSDAILTPSLPRNIREDIKVLNQRPMAASLPRNFGASSLSLEINGKNKMDIISDFPHQGSDLLLDLSENKKHISEDLSNIAKVEFQETTTNSNQTKENTWSKWWFSRQDAKPPKLRFSKRAKPLQRQLQALDLKRGRNIIKYIVTGRVLGTQEIEASIYLWNYDDKIVISDVDGTITKSDVFGHVLPLIGMDWSHRGIAELYTSIVKNGYKIIYLTARSIVQSASTREYISSLRQGELSLPEGPIIMSSDRLFASFSREVILRKPEEFKIATLNEIKSLFETKDNPQPFFAGFGNRITDTISYKTVGIPDHKIFMIDTTGNIKVYDTLNHKSYTDVHQLVNLMFPDVKSKFVSTDLSYWNLSIPSVKSLEDLRNNNIDNE